MKNLLFGLMATVLFTHLSFGQNREVFNEFEIIKNENINFDNEIVQIF